MFSLFSLFILLTISSSLSVGSIMPPCFSLLFTSFSSVCSAGLLTLPSWKPPVSFFGLATPPCGDLRATQIIPRVLQKLSYLTPSRIVSKCFVRLGSITLSLSKRRRSVEYSVSCTICLAFAVSGDHHHKVYIKATLGERGQLVKKEITSLTHLTPASCSLLCRVTWFSSDHPTQYFLFFSHATKRSHRARCIVCCRLSLSFSFSISTES